MTLIVRCPSAELIACVFFRFFLFIFYGYRCLVFIL